MTHFDNTYPRTGLIMAGPTYEEQVEERRYSRVYGPETRFVVGLDLGQAQDFTAIAVDEVQAFDAVTEVKLRFGPGFEVERRRRKHHHRIVNRFPRGTLYPDVDLSVEGILRQLPTRAVAPELVVDRTGVAAPVVDSLRDRGLRPISVGITAGAAVRQVDRWNVNVPKATLASGLDAVMGDGRIDITDAAQASEALRFELASFSVKTTRAGNQTFEAHRESDHDDLVLALALAVWRGENPPGEARMLPFSIHG